MVRPSPRIDDGKHLTTFAVSIVIISIWATSIFAQAPPYDAGANGQPLITIVTSKNQLDLSEVTSVTPLSRLSETPYPTHGSFTVDVRSLLPEWGVWISAESLHGIEGNLPSNRIWVSASGTGNEFMPLDSQVRVLSGDRSTPVASASVSVSVQPSWLDVAGVYTSDIIIGPEDPTPYYIDDDGTMARRSEQREARAGDRIGICIRIQECIDLSVSSAEASFEKVTGPGYFAIANDIELHLSTNTRRWKVVVDTVALRHATRPDWVLPVERVHWELREFQATTPAGEGNLYAGATLLEGHAPVENLRAQLSFTIEILPSDPAGEYRLELNLSGQVGD